MGLLTDVLGSTRKLPRRQRIAIEGSPPFAFTNASIAASGVWVINILENTAHLTQMAKYTPMDFLEVVNDSMLDIEITLNDVMTYRILNQASRIIQDRPFTALSITNLSTTAIAADLLHLIIERKPVDEDVQLRRVLRRGA